MTDERTQALLVRSVKAVGVSMLRNVPLELRLREGSQPYHTLWTADPTATFDGLKAAVAVAHIEERYKTKDNIKPSGRTLLSASGALLPKDLEGIVLQLVVVCPGGHRHRDSEVQALQPGDWLFAVTTPDPKSLHLSLKCFTIG